jgi:hypothetical protein
LVQSRQRGVEIALNENARARVDGTEYLDPNLLDLKLPIEDAEMPVE